MQLIESILKKGMQEPETIAVNDCCGNAISYSQLTDLSGRVYYYLKEKGIGREDFVNILLPRGVNAFISIIGIWRAGAAAVVLEEDYPAERVKYIQNDCGCKLVIDLEEWEKIMDCESLSGYESVDVHDAAFAVYTSGSTGNPKGVLHEFGNIDLIINSFDINLSAFGLISPLNFVATIIALIKVFFDGGTLFVIPYKILKNPKALTECFINNQIVEVFSAPSIYALFQKIPTLNILIVSSEPAFGIWSEDPKFSVYNYYVMSESGFIVTSVKLDKPNETAPIGKPQFDLDIILRDEEGHPVEGEESGEICFECPFVRGYINLQEQTDKAYINGEFHTGDIGKRLPNGDLVVIGRKDDMVKINGNRVEPAEIENAVRRITGLRNVIAKAFIEGEAASICVYYTENIEIDEVKVINELSELLPYYMVPARFVHLDAFPRTGSGKISRRLLPKLNFGTSEKDYVEPANPTEKALCDCMASVLNLERIGAEDDFYAIGGSSVTSMAVVGSCPLPGLDIGMIFRGRTPRKIASVYLESLVSNESASDFDFSEEKLNQPCPLTQTQLGIYFESVKRKGEAVYNNPILLRFSEEMDIKKLSSSVSAAILAHPGLFAEITNDLSGKPSILFCKERLEDDFCKILSMTEDEFEQHKSCLVRPFDILSDQLFRIEIYKTESAVYLFMDFHHIIFDGTSAHIIFDDISRAFSGKAVIKEDYTAYHASLDEIKFRESKVYQQAKDWYLENFSDIENVSLPEGDKREKEIHHAELSVSLDVKPDTLRLFCEKYLISENVVTTAAFGVLLSSYVGNDTPAFTTVYNGRKDIKTNRTVSMFVKTLPVVCRIKNDCSIADYLKAVKEQLLGCMANDIYSFAELSSSTAFSSDVSFVWQERMHEIPDLDGQKVTREYIPFQATGDPLSVELREQDSQLVLILQYHSNRYSEDFISRFAVHYGCVLEEIMEKSWLKDVSLIDSKETNELLSFGRGEEQVYDSEKTWLDLFHKCVEASPEKIAVTDNEGSLTYGELDKISNSVAAYLIDRGIRENSFVAVRMGRVKEFVAAVIGIQKAGAAYVPIDEEYPQDRVDYMVEDSQTKIIMTLESVSEAVKEYPDADSICLATSDHLAYMIYTSGSTGKPKGVMIAHRAVLNFIHFICRRWGITEDSRVACHSNFAFDASVEDLFPALTVGGLVFIVPEAERHDVQKMKKYIKDNLINGGSYSTQFGQLLTEKTPLDVDYVCMGGEKMTSIPLCRGKVYNAYGPTEFTVDATYYEVDPERSYTNIPIGRPLDNCNAFVLDNRGQLVPKGVIGELCLAGPQIAEGYWQRPELTEEKFTDCPYLPGKKMYHTGDLVCWNEDGQLVYMGRMDNQIKLRGFRIELGEIESRAGQYEGVTSAVAEVRMNHLILYYTVEKETDQEDLRAFLAERLTDYMMPHIYMQLDEMPMTPNGKINRKALPDPIITSESAYIDLEGEVEHIVADVMMQILGMEKAPGALDNFFELGGDSIEAIRFCSLLRDQGISITVADIMREKTVRGIAEASGTIEKEISQEPFTGAISDTPITALFKDLELPEPWHYNQTLLLRMKEQADKVKLQQAWNSLTFQHDMLRAVYIDGTLTVRDANVIIPIEEFNVDSEEEITKVCENVQSHIDMQHALVRTALIHCANEDYFYIASHHLVIDGVSWRIVLSDLENAYSQIMTGKDIQLSKKTNTYADYAEAVIKYRNSYQLSREIAYWNHVEQLLESYRLSKSKDYSCSFGHIEFTLKREDTQKIIDADYGTRHLEFYDALLTALCRSYRVVIGEQSVAVQLEGHGREDIGSELTLDRTVGWFTSIFPVVFEELDGDVSHDLKTVKETIRRVPNKGVGYNILRYIEGDNKILLNKDEVPPVSFNYMGDMDSEMESKDSYFMGTDIETGRDFSSKNAEGSELSINCLVSHGCFRLMLDYDCEKYTEETANAFAKSFLDEISSIVDYLEDSSVQIVTASDYGEKEWSNEEFESVIAGFASRGERVERIYPLLPMQESMLLKHLSEPESWAYRIVDIYEINGVPTEEQMRNVLDRLGRKHEVLRTSIIHKNVSVPRQAIIDRKLGLTMVDLSENSDPEAEVFKLREEILINGFDLEEVPLFRLVCAKKDENHTYLIIIQHHIIIDGWSLQFYMQDLIHFMMEEMNGNRTQDSEPVKGQYEAAVKELLQKDENIALDYWHNLLADYETPTGILSAGEVPVEERSISDELSILLSREETERLDAICREEGATLSNGLELVWGLILGVYNRIEDVVFAKVVSGRDNTKVNVNDIVGLFINSIPVRIRWNEDTTARDALKALQQQTTESNTYDFCALSQIQQQTTLGSDLVQSIFAFENYSSEKSLSLPESFIRTVWQKEEQFNTIEPVAFIRDGRIMFKLSFDTSHYREYEIQNILYLFRQIVRQIIERPDQPLCTLNWLNEEEIQDVINLGSGEVYKYNEDSTWLDLFLTRAKEISEKIAVTDNESSLTYGELDKVSNSVAAYLIDRGVRENSFVAVRMGRVKEFVAAVIGIQKAGAAYVPIDEEYPQDRVDYMVEDSQAKIIMTAEFVSEAMKEYPDAVSICRATPNHLAYMIYTSGSTGRPKGVMISHRALRSFANNIFKIYSLNENSHISCHSNFAFDASVWDMFPVLSAGGHFFIVPENLRRDITGMRSFINKNKIDGGIFSTQFGTLLASDEPLNLKYMCVGGEALTSVPLCTGKVFNAYGPTEFTVAATCFEVDSDKSYSKIPIGRPLDNCKAFVLDKRGQLIPKGMIGELCLAGPQIAEGYWQRPELTEEKFTDCPYLPGKKMYHTGDLVRWNEDGQLVYMGRIDNQIKLRGFRIELGEIESRAGQYDGVTSAVAEVRMNQLVLYYTAEKEIKQEDIRAFLAEKLTDYMIPNIYIQLDEMPMTPNGKVNRKVLPDPDITEFKAPYIAPRNEMEKKLCKLFEEVLELDEGSIGVNDDFFAIGGDSIRCMRMVSLAQIENLSIADIYRYRTPSGLAAILSAAPSDDITEDEARTITIPATDGQISMMDYQFLRVKSVMYNIPILYRIDNSLDESYIENVINTVIRNHPALATVFEVDEDGVFVERYRPELFPTAHWEDIPSEELHDVIDSLVQPFVDFKKPLFRLRLLRSGEVRYLFMDMHHMISDGFSIGVLTENFVRAFKGEALPQDCYYSYLVKEHRIKQTDAYQEAKMYFQNLLADTDWCNIPLPDYESWDADEAEELLSLAITTEEINSAAKKLRVSPNVLCITAGMMAMQEYSKKSDILIKWIDHNRVQEKFANTVGLLFKIFPVAIHMDEYSSTISLIDEVRRQTEEDFAHSACDYMGMTEAALEDALEINYVEALENGSKTEELWEVKLNYNSNVVGERVGLYIMGIEGVLFVSCDYQKKIYAPGSMSRFLELFKKNLRSIVLGKAENEEN